LELCGIGGDHLGPPSLHGDLDIGSGESLVGHLGAPSPVCKFGAEGLNGGRVAGLAGLRLPVGCAEGVGVVVQSATSDQPRGGIGRLGL